MLLLNYGKFNLNIGQKAKEVASSVHKECSHDRGRAWRNCKTPGSKIQRNLMEHQPKLISGWSLRFDVKKVSITITGDLKTWR
jgi:hypothetical protein